MSKKSKELVILNDDWFDQEPDANDIVAERLANLYVPHPGLKDIRKGIRELVKYGNIGMYAKRPARSAVIVGESGSGKSRLLNEVCHPFPMYIENGKPVFRILNVSVPSNATVKGLNAAINRAMGVPEAFVMEGTEGQQTEIMLQRLKEYKVRLLILDEVHHLFKDGKKIIQKVSDHIVALLNNKVCPVLIVGTGRALDIFDLIPDQRRRSLGVYYLEAMDWNNDKEKAHYISFLHDLEEQMEFKVRPKLWKKDTALRLYIFTGGLIGLTADVVIAATIRAMEDGEDTITHDVLRKVVDRMKRQNKLPQPNPFNANAKLMPVKSKIRVSEQVNAWAGNKKLRQSTLLPQ